MCQCVYTDLAPSRHSTNIIFLSFLPSMNTYIKYRCIFISCMEILVGVSEMGVGLNWGGL